MLQYLVDTINGGDSGSFTKASEESVNSEFITNGKNVMRLPATEPYNFGFQLLDVFYTKLSKSLLYKTKRSKKSALNEDKVQRLLNLVEKRYV